MPLVVAVSACAVPAQYGGPIPIDHAGLVGRFRRACELGKITSIEGPCTSAPADSELDESDLAPNDGVQPDHR